MFSDTPGIVKYPHTSQGQWKVFGKIGCLYNADVIFASWRKVNPARLNILVTISRVVYLIYAVVKAFIYFASKVSIKVDIVKSLKLTNVFIIDLKS